MAIGTAALIIILSITNGFDRIIQENLSDLDPDYTIVSLGGSFEPDPEILAQQGESKKAAQIRSGSLGDSSEPSPEMLAQLAESKEAAQIRSGSLGGSFEPDPEMLAQLAECKGVTQIRGSVEQNVILSYDGKQAIARVKGVESSYAGTLSPLASHIIAGEFSLYEGDVPQACVGAGLARSLGLSPRFLEKLTLLYPGKENAMPLLGPMGALGSVRVSVGSVFSVNADVDNSLVIIPIDEARQLCGMGGQELSRLEISLAGKPTRALKKQLESIADAAGCMVLEREQLHPEIYKMLRHEKLSIYIILLFVVIIIAFNIFGSMSMLIIEKRPDMQTLAAMGAPESMVRRIFVLEGWMISLLGLASGLALGVGVALLQQHFGIVKMPGSFALNPYPAVLQAGDVLLTAAGVALTGLAVSLLASRSRQ